MERFAYFSRSGRSGVVVKWAQKPEIAARRNSGNPRQGPPHAHTFVFKRQRHSVVKILLINSKKFRVFVAMFASRS